MDKKVSLQIPISQFTDSIAEIIKNCGFKYVSISFDDNSILLANDFKCELQKVFEILKKNTLKCNMIHAPYYHLLISAENYDDDMELAILRSIEATKILGSQICVVHPRSVIIENVPREDSVDRVASLEKNLIYFKPLIKECEKHDVLLGIENLMKYPNDFPPFYSYIVEDHIKLIDSLKSDKVCAIWDFGHANLVDDDHVERIKKLGNRIKGTHIHNNDGVNDCHYPPFIPESSAYFVKRTVDWENTLSALGSTGFDGFLTLETTINFAYPTEPFIKYLFENVCFLKKFCKN